MPKGKGRPRSRKVKVRYPGTKHSKKTLNGKRTWK